MIAVPSRRNSGLETTSKWSRIDAAPVQHPPDPFVGIDRNGALLDDDLVAGNGAGNLGDDRFHIGQVGGAGLALGRTDGDEDGLALLDRSAQVGGEINAASEVLA